MELYNNGNIPLTRHCFNTLLVFMYIFMVRVRGLIDTSIVAGIIAILLLALNRRALNRCIYTLFCKKVLRIYLIYFVMIVWILFVVLVNGTNDFSFLTPLIHGLVQIIIGIVLYSYLWGKHSEKYVTTYIVISFAIQSIIEWGAMISPSVKAFVYSTKDAETIRVANKYSGIRGLSLSGSSFFGLALAFGFVYILFFSEKNLVFRKHPIYRYILFAVLVTGTFFAGRTGLISLPIVLAYFVIKRSKQKNNLTTKTFIESLVVIVVAIIMIIILMNTFDLNDTVLNKLGYLRNYVLEFWDSFTSSGRFSTTSSLHMFEDMYFKIPFSTFLLGDGQYTVASGYYMGTDVGYMRPVLYMGIPGLIMLFLLQRRILRLGNVEKNINLLLWIFLFISQLKGEAVGFSLLVINMLTLYSLSPSINEELPHVE